MRTSSCLRSLVVFGALAAASLTTAGCVSDRESRNGVFNENQYVRKDFLIQPGDGSKPDPGWFLKATVTAVSTPNALGAVAGIWPGSENGSVAGATMVRFAVLQDKLQLLSMREISPTPSNARTAEVVNAWPITNVDLKYRINLDGEKTNFFEENQELDWQVRQWVKLSFAKNDLSDLAVFDQFTNDTLSRCADMGNASTAMVPDSFLVDEPNNYMEWKVNITLPVKLDDDACLAATQNTYGSDLDVALKLGRKNVSFDLKYSMTRVKAVDPTAYTPLVLDEKDPIQHKYGPLVTDTIVRDPDSGQLASRRLVNRFNPNEPIVWYFAEGFPEHYKEFFTKKDGIVDQTNKILETAQVKARVTFKNFNDDLADGQAPRQPGDIRYSFIRWIPDVDSGSGFLGVEQSVPDPRTGELISSSININDYPVKDRLTQHLDVYLKSLGLSDDVNSAGDWPDGPAGCKDGDILPIAVSVKATIDAQNQMNGVTDAPEATGADIAQAQHNNSSLYQKMQTYLQRPAASYGNLAPSDFIAPQDDDFYRAYYALLPYHVYADPAANFFVTPEGGSGTYGPDSSQIFDIFAQETQFQRLAAKIDRGEAPYEGESGPDGVKNALGFLNQMKQLTLAHRDFEYKKQFLHPHQRLDAPNIISLQAVAKDASRRCVAGKWQTKQEWIDNQVDIFWELTMWHEFGHALGLDHNFMASVDRPNFPTYQDGSGNQRIALYSSSVMEYNQRYVDVAARPVWAPYDQGALAWIYANSTKSGDAGTSITGQASPTVPWKDPLGFAADGTTEKNFLYCSAVHEKYTPLCRTFDLGSTPSEIMANQIEEYESNYQWRNFRTYRKFWDDSSYANGPANTIVDMRRFLSLWAFDWGSGELADSLRRIGIQNPDPQGSDLEYYTALTNKYNKEASSANQMVAAFHKAVIQQSSGERPYKTIYDKYYGDVTQQGIILDKLFAMQGWVALWPTDNYDANQAGAYIASYSGIGDSSYGYVAADAVNSMVGGQYDVFPYFVPLAVAQFAQDTHDPSFSGAPEVRDWIGGHVFYRLDDFLAYFRDIAVQNNEPGCDSVATCTYDPRGLSDTHNEFVGPDLRHWIWAYIPDRNTWVAVQKERNTASYVIIRNYTDYVIFQQDDGAFPGGAYSALLPLKFFLDSFNSFN